MLTNALLDTHHGVTRYDRVTRFFRTDTLANHLAELDHATQPASHSSKTPTTQTC